MQIANFVDEQASTALLTATDVADRLKMAKTGVYALLARGDLAHLRIGRLVRVREEDLSAYLASCRVATDSSLSTNPYGVYPEA